MFRACVILAAIAAVAAVLLVPAGASASSCRNLKVTSRTRDALSRAHGEGTRPKKGSVYYGRCGRTYYALATFPALADQPERFRRRAGGSWRDIGDTGGYVCNAAPDQLLRLWRLDDNC